MADGYPPVTEENEMRVENMKVDGNAVTATVFLQKSRVPKTDNPFKRASSYEKSIIKAFEYRGWVVTVDNFLPDADDPGKIAVCVTRVNSERDDSLRECKRWNVKTAAVRKIAALSACAPLLLTYVQEGV